MTTRHVSPTFAHRDHARGHGIPLADVAESVVNRTLVL
jgi:hypothetical protein